MIFIEIVLHASTYLLYKYFVGSVDVCRFDVLTS